MIEYILPDFVNGYKRNLVFLWLAQHHPDYFNADVHLHSVYGCFPGCIFNGGRSFVRDAFTAQQIDATFSQMELYGAKTRLTFTNMLVDESHLSDEYFNTILDVASHHDVEIIVHSDVVDRYIRERYDFPLVLSTTRKLSGIEEFNRATERFDYVVMDYNHNKDDEFLRGITHPEKTEMMVNEYCQLGCAHRQQHYRHNSRCQLEGTLTDFTACEMKENLYGKHVCGAESMLTCEDVRRIYDTYHIPYFKIVGRGVPENTTIDAYVHYLIKPNYRAFVAAEVKSKVRR